MQKIIKIDEIYHLLQYFNLDKEKCGICDSIDFENYQIIDDDWERNILCVLAGFKMVALVDYDEDYGEPGIVTNIILDHEGDVIDLKNLPGIM